MTTAAPPPRRLLLPGLRVLDRGRDEWQLGIDPATATRVRRTPALDRVLAALQDGHPLPHDPEARRALRLLEPHTMSLPTLPGTPLGQGDHAALLQRGPGHEARLAGRSRALVRLIGSLGVDPGPLLKAAGVQVTDHAPTMVLMLSDGELPRSELDPWVRAGVPHLVVRRLDGVITLGPFVVPGQTACLRCIDAHLALADPLHHAMVAEHARAAAVTRYDGIAEPRDTALASLAVAWAVRDLVTQAEGDRPTTWSATIRLEAGLSAITDVHWLRHPECGCSWDGALPSTRTMER